MSNLEDNYAIPMATPVAELLILTIPICNGIKHDPLTIAKVINEAVKDRLISARGL